MRSPTHHAAVVMEPGDNEGEHGEHGELLWSSRSGLCHVMHSKFVSESFDTANQLLVVHVILRRHDC